MSVRTVPNVHRLTLALLAALALPALAQETPAPADASGKAAVKTLDRMTVTGSRIKRVEMEEALPITSITREQICLLYTSRYV